MYSHLMETMTFGLLITREMFAKLINFSWYFFLLRYSNLIYVYKNRDLCKKKLKANVVVRTLLDMYNNKDKIVIRTTLDLTIESLNDSLNSKEFSSIIKWDGKWKRYMLNDLDFNLSYRHISKSGLFWTQVSHC